MFIKMLLNVVYKFFRLKDYVLIIFDLLAKFRMTSAILKLFITRTLGAQIKKKNLYPANLGCLAFHIPVAVKSQKRIFQFVYN